MLIWILAFSMLGSIGAVVGAGALLYFPANLKRVPALISYATGTLLGAAFLGMLPASLERGDASEICATVLAGIVIFFILDKVTLWRHCHDSGCEVHVRAAPLILIGDAFHNFVDGAAIAAAFLTSMGLGVATSLAIVAHEVPQEVGDFAILIDGGYTRGKALALNTLSASTTLPGAVAAYYWFNDLGAAMPYILAVSAASFIYIAMADLIPGLHRQTSPAASIRQIAVLAAGIGTIAVFHWGK